MLPYTYGVAAYQRVQPARSLPADKRLEAMKLAFENGADGRLLIQSTNRVLTIAPDGRGVLRIPFSEDLLAEDPWVVFPPCGIRFLGFQFPEPKGR
jgi:hypothetical protein